MKHLFYITLLFITLLPGYSFPETWAIFLYMDSSDEMNDVAIKNISDLMRALPRENVTIAIQLHAFGSTAYRYIIKNNALISTETINLMTKSIQNFIDGAQWAFGNHPSDHTLLLLWNHGSGALEPTWNESTHQWEFEEDLQSEINQLEPDEIFENATSCPLRSRLGRLPHRGYMFSLAPREYLTNNDLIIVFEAICKKLGRKLDIICFDTCMGAMLENSYQCAPFADYLVGVQSCAAKDGLNYEAFGQVFFDPAATPRAIASALVKTFNDYYTLQESIGLNAAVDTKSIFTLTALDLSKIALIKDLLDRAVEQIYACTTMYDIKSLRKAFRTAHSECATLCLFPMYVDLYSLLSFFDTKLETFKPSDQLTLLRTTLKQLCTAITDAVIAHCYGKALKGLAHGISIYCPHYHVDSSYADIQFGKDAQWGKMLPLTTGEIMQIS